LLRAIEEREVTRMGATSPRHVDVRLVSATTEDLEEAMLEGRFRKDLFFQLNGFELKIPPLRERVDEIGQLAKAFIEARCRSDSRPGLPLSPDALRELQRYDWPGNVGELRNVVERAVIICLDGAILPEHLPPLSGELEPPPGPTLKEGVAEAEKRKILEALDSCEGNRSLAAKQLGIARRTLSYRLAQYGITPKVKRR
jgi:sigma-54-dependent transcriptional regulator